MVEHMFDLYDQYYDSVSEQQFKIDLFGKQYIITLKDSDGHLRGFSTAAISEHQFNGKLIRTFFSGDTVIDQRFWGQQALPRAWFRLTGAVKAEIPDVPLYWFLLVKGHRTYRYLRAFFKEFYPAYDQPTPTETKALMAMLAVDRFGALFFPDDGVVRFPRSHGHLKSELATIPAKDAHRPDVQFFLGSNPGYVRGEELVCIAELTAANLRPVARRLFLQG